MSLFCIDEQFGRRIIKLKKNTIFSKRMDSHLSKTSFEYQVLAILRLILGKEANEFVKSESPDLQNIRKSIGIEVVTSYPADTRKVQELERRLADEEKNGDIEKVDVIKTRIEDAERFKVLSNNQVLYPADLCGEKITFCNIVRQKTKKIKQYEENGFNHIGLFVWHLSPVLTDFCDNVEEKWEALLKKEKNYSENNFSYTKVYTSDYANSSIRLWLNNSFFNTAFSDNQMSNILPTNLNNDSFSLSTYNSDPTNDRVFLLSLDEVTNPDFGFNSIRSNDDAYRRLQGSDYAKCQGLFVRENSGNIDDGYSCWRLRTPNDCSYAGCGIYTDGDAVSGCYTWDTSIGIVPAFRIGDWDRLDYLIAYYTDSETEAPIIQTKAHNDNLFLYDRTPTKEGYIFTGWNTRLDGSGTSYNPGDEYQANESLDLYAQWEKIVLTGISVKTAPSTVSYFVGDTLDTFGLSLTAAYSDGTTITVENGYSCNPTTLNTAGAQAITVTYMGFTCSFSVDVQAIEVTGISIINEPDKIEYYVGDTPDLTGLKLELSMNNGSSQVITEGFTCDTARFERTGTQLVNVIYGKFFCSYVVNVRGKVKSVSIGDMEINYKQSAKLNPTINADEDVKYTVSYLSSNPNVVKVNEKIGEVTGAKMGAVTLTCTVTDEFGNTVSDVCQVTVKYTAWQWVIIILLFGWIWY